jgi:hypothetical protein
MTPYVCENCGLEKAESICGATASLICCGHYPITGCGAVLTAHERHYYGSCCEGCEREWGETIAAWRAGGENAELDAMFDDKPRSH